MNGETDRKRNVKRETPAPLSAGARQAGKGGERRYCIPCAISRPDFRERIPFGCPVVPFQEGEEPRAWIGGRGYSLVRHPGSSVSCTDCGEVIRTAYCPEESR